MTRCIHSRTYASLRQSVHACRCSNRQRNHVLARKPPGQQHTQHAWGGHRTTRYSFPWARSRRSRSTRRATFSALVNTGCLVPNKSVKLMRRVRYPGLKLSVAVRWNRLELKMTHRFWRCGTRSTSYCWPLPTCCADVAVALGMLFNRSPSHSNLQATQQRGQSSWCERRSHGAGTIAQYGCTATYTAAALPLKSLNVHSSGASMSYTCIPPVVGSRLCSSGASLYTQGAHSTTHAAAG